MAANNIGAATLPRIVVYVDGGNVQAVYASDPTTEVELVDFDNLVAEGKNTGQREVALADAIAGLVQVL